MIDFTALSPRTMSLGIAALCVAALGAALASEHWGGLLPCVLCFYQRYAYLAALLFGALGFLVAKRTLAHRASVALAGVSFLTGSGIAFFHAGVEQKWWRGTDECHAPDIDPSLSVEEMKDLLLNQTFVPCDEIPWSIFGVSMAGWNFLAMLAFALFCFWWLAMRRKGAS